MATHVMGLGWSLLVDIIIGFKGKYREKYFNL
jgi:hypothetical protein